jgi:hypothetical protein
MRGFGVLRSNCQPNFLERRILGSTFRSINGTFEITSLNWLQESARLRSRVRSVFVKVYGCLKVVALIQSNVAGA